MYIAMNRFKVLKDSTDTFETTWRNRETYLHECEGFQSFHLLRGPEHDDYVLYASHTVWDSHDHFVAWTQSEQFRKAHAQAGAGAKPVTVGPPSFEGFESVLSQ